MTITLVDNNPVFKVGLKKILTDAFESIDFQDFESLDDMIQADQQKHPNLLIITLHSAFDSFMSLEKSSTNFLQSQDTLILSSTCDYMCFKKTMTLKANGYVRIDAAPNELIYAIKTIQKGMVFIDTAFDTSFVPTYTEKLIETLTPREQQVFKLIGEGMTNKEISQKLVISINTVKKHVNRIMSKLEIHDRIHLLMISKDFF